MIFLILFLVLLLSIHIILYPKRHTTKILSIKQHNTIGKIVTYSGRYPPTQREIEEYEKT